VAVAASLNEVTGRAVIQSSPSERPPLGLAGTDESRRAHERHDVRGASLAPPSVVAKAIEAAWIVFQIEEGGLARVYGLAGEAAAKAILSNVLGVDPALIANLNDFAANFPIVDVATPRGFFSVKVRGVASTLAGEELEAAVRSQYTSDLFDLAVGGPRADRKLLKAAKGLLKIKAELGRSWPTDLKALCPEGVAKYIRENAKFLFPHNHVQLARRMLGKDLVEGTIGHNLAKRIQSSKKFLDQLGIKNQADLVAFVNRQVDRIDSLHVTSKEFQVLAQAAAKFVPEQQIPRLRPALERLKRKQQRRLKLDD
jgi:hypothetical protein